jgi:hypothetical protein
VLLKSTQAAGLSRHSLSSVRLRHRRAHHLIGFGVDDGARVLSVMVFCCAPLRARLPSGQRTCRVFFLLIEGAGWWSQRGHAARPMPTIHMVTWGSHGGGLACNIRANTRKKHKTWGLLRPKSITTVLTRAAKPVVYFWCCNPRTQPSSHPCL